MLQFNTSNNMAGISGNNNTWMNAAGGESNLEKQQVSSSNSNPPVSCFVIEHNSFIEVKDCCIKSVKDKKNFD